METDKPSSLRRFFSISATDLNAGAVQLQPSVGQILRSKRVRVLVTAAVLLTITGIFLNSSHNGFDFGYLQHPFSLSSSSPLLPETQPPTSLPEGIDWSRYAYTQYATDTAYLCNSVMLFETLHRLGSRADRLLMYPNKMRANSPDESTDSRLLIKARDEYGVKLMPIQVQHRDGDDPNSITWADSYTKLLAFNQTQYDRVLSLDSDSTILQPMDELFFMPPAPVAMPRAYWLTKKPTLSSQVVLIEPTEEEFARIMSAIDHAKNNEFDMEIVNNLYRNDCLIIPHRRYDLVSGEFKHVGAHEHANYLGNPDELWDPAQMLAEAKYVHFSDWPVPKPWVPTPHTILRDEQPACITDSAGHEDCRARDIWLGLYSGFRDRRLSVCNMKV